MPASPPISFSLSPSGPAITPDSDVWHLPLPMTRQLNRARNDPTGDLSISHAEYFCAVREFLVKDRFNRLVEAVNRTAGFQVDPEHIDDIRICLEKHGAFYHPARVCVRIETGLLLFVVNVAVSRTGVATMDREHRLIKTLGKDAPLSFLPQVYGTGTVHTPGGRCLQLFMGQWFGGYYEFHQSIDARDGQTKLIVWDTDTGNYWLTTAQREALYRQVAMILTWYYNLETFEQIFSWHHAAGDFVVKSTRKDRADVRLITVRRYAPMFDGVDPTPETVLQGLMVFFLNLSVRTRLDRLDGVGGVTWSEPAAVNATLDGFIQGLALKEKSAAVPHGFTDYFKGHMAVHTEAELCDLVHGLLGRYPEKSPDLPVAAAHIDEHVRALHHAIGGLNSRNGSQPFH